MTTLVKKKKKKKSHRFWDKNQGQKPGLETRTVCLQMLCLEQLQLIVSYWPLNKG